MSYNPYSVLLALIPLLMNLGLLLYIMSKFPKDKRTNLFLLFLIAQVFWQLEEVLLRTINSSDLKYLIDGFLCIGWIFLGALLLHFCLYLVESPLKGNSKFIWINYGVTLLFYLSYINYPMPVAFTEHEFFGFIPSVRQGSPDVYKRLWISGQVFFALFLMAKFIISNSGKKKQNLKVEQVKWVLLGCSIPALVGFFTQLVVPVLGYNEIALTSTSMIAVSVFSFIGMKRANLFNYFENISINKIIKEMNNIMIFFDRDLNVKFSNTYAEKIFSMKANNTNNLKALLDEDSLNELRVAILSGDEFSSFNHLNFRGISRQEISVNLSIHKVPISSEEDHFILIGNDVSDTQEYKQKLETFTKYFKYFLDASNDAFFELNPSSGEILWNGTEKKIFGKNKSNILYSIKNLEDYFNRSQLCPEFRFFLDWVFSLNTEAKSFHLNVRRCDGESLYLSLNALKIRNDKNNTYKVIGTLRDVTSEYEYFKEISKRDNALREIAWIQSHRVRAPLANIIGLVWALKSDDELSEQSRTDFFEALEKSAIELDKVIKDVVQKTGDIKN